MNQENGQDNAPVIRVANLSKAYGKVRAVSNLSFDSIMPLTFLASFPPEMLPGSINAITPWLPTSMAIELVGSLFVSNQLPENAWLSVIGLLAYTTLFSLISNTRRSD